MLCGVMQPILLAQTTPPVVSLRCVQDEVTTVPCPVLKSVLFVLGRLQQTR